MATERIRLSGGPDKTVTWAWLEDDGSLVIEYYDHSEEGERFLGNDVAYILTIPADEVPRFLLTLFSERFTSYFDVKAWLEAKEIPFTKRVEDPA
jgi:hypothetical protein